MRNKKVKNIVLSSEFKLTMLNTLKRHSLTSHCSRLASQAPEFYRSTYSLGNSGVAI